MILMHRNMIFLSLALGVMPALQGTMLTRVTSKLPAVATLKKAVTWKRAGLGACVLAFLAYKTFVKTDDQVYRDFERQFTRDAMAIATTEQSNAVHAEITSRKTLHWFGRYAIGLSYTGTISFEKGLTTHYRGSITHSIKPGYLFDTHGFDARVTITKYNPELDSSSPEYKPWKALLQDKQGAST